MGRVAHADRGHLARCRVSQNGPGRSGRDESACQRWQRLVSSPQYVGGVSASGAGASRNAQATGRGGYSRADTTATRARERAARERLERIEEAMRQCEELQRQREASTGRKGREARASTTDPERGS